MLAVVHPTYALFTLLVLGGYAVVRLLVVPEELPTLAIAGSALALGAIVFLAWLFPTVQGTASFTPSGEQVQSKQHGFDRYPGQFIVKSDSRFHLNPEVITRAGPVPLAALCLVPLALFAARRRWAALVLGGTLAVLGVLLLDHVFAPFADAVSLVAGAATRRFSPDRVRARQAARPCSRGWSRTRCCRSRLPRGSRSSGRGRATSATALKEGGPTLPVWIAAGGALLAVGLAVALRSRLPTFERTDWVPAAVVRPSSSCP